MIVISFPKSGRTWLSYMLSDYYDFFYAKKHFSARGLKLLEEGKLKPSNWVTTFHKIDVNILNRLKKTYDKKVIYLLRDPRDCLTSFYFYKIYHKKNFTVKLYYWLKINGFKKKFIKKTLEDWKNHVNTYLKEADVLIRYEDLLDETQGKPVECLSGIIDNVDKDKLKNVLEKYSFKNSTGRQPGDGLKSSFARKGIKGDWINYFNSESHKKTMKDVIGKDLVRFNYEKDENW